MLKLSVVIVNYNVRYFLEQCLLSVEKAGKGLEMEVFVVDNNSVDGSVEMVRTRFPWVKLIANADNKGFSKANNQALKIATGEYQLLLNPDTVVEEDTFIKVIRFMDEHPDAGGLGVRMVDGKGIFLPESKRGLPTPETAFYKIFGISRLFPHSRKFNRYHLGYLDEHQTHEVEILSGAFMLMRKAALDKIGLLDEAFFMYGEDIDLSWRIIQGGWKNYYFPETRIIHYKGESTKKGSLNYVFVFYNAMVIFARKHFSETNAKWFSFFIHLAIWVRASAAVLNRFVRSMILPLSDAAFSLTGLYLLKDLYAETAHKIYDPNLIRMAFGSYALIWIISVWTGGGYDKPLRPLRVIKPLLAGSAFIAIAYSFLPESLRFSRALLLIGVATAIAVFFLNRIAANLLKGQGTGLQPQGSRRFAIVGKEDEVARVLSILRQTNYNLGFVASVTPERQISGDFIGSVSQLDEIIRIHNIDSVIFCARDISSGDIISSMSTCADKSTEFKIAPPEALYIIGSNSIETSSDLFILDVNSVDKPANRRRKRMLDVTISVLFIPLIPLALVLMRKPVSFLRNLFDVLVGRRTWVGFNPAGGHKPGELPKLKPGVLHTGSAVGKELVNSQAMKLNVLYARDYRMSTDLAMIFRCFRDLGS